MAVVWVTSKSLARLCEPFRSFRFYKFFPFSSSCLIPVRYFEEQKFPRGYLRKATGLQGPKIVRLLIGNPLVMNEMAKHVPDAGSYAPVTVLVDEREDGVHLSYDRMASLLGPYGNASALAVARDLDSKIEALIRESAA